MNKRVLAVGALLALVIALCVYRASQPGFHPAEVVETNGEVASSAPANPRTYIPPVTSIAANVGQRVDPADTAMVTNTPLSAETVLQNVRRSLRLYSEMFGGNPVGNNAEITQALNGKNPRQAHFVDSSAGMQINGQGELVDQWGTPYFFHQLSADEMELHSAGPDKKMWTADDLIVK